MNMSDADYTASNCEEVKKILSKNSHCNHVIPLTCGFIGQNPGKYVLSPFSAAAGLQTISVSLRDSEGKESWVHCSEGVDCDDEDILKQ